jgi:hypothetical protein
MYLSRYCKNHRSRVKRTPAITAGIAQTSDRSLSNPFLD